MVRLTVTWLTSKWGCQIDGPAGAAGLDHFRDRLDIVLGQFGGMGPTECGRAARNSGPILVARRRSEWAEGSL